jgi:hypothetical protein
VAETYRNLLVTREFRDSLGSIDPGLTDAELDGVLSALDQLDANPAARTGTNRLHLLDRELQGWWSLTPTVPPDTLLRIVIRPEKINGQGVWRVGFLTRHYHR